MPVILRHIYGMKIKHIIDRQNDKQKTINFSKIKN